MNKNLFTPATTAWFAQAFDAPTPVQEDGWERIAEGEHALLLAPTGSGKTLAAFLWVIDRLLQLPADATPGVRVLYVSPLKALAYDIERNLRAPLVGTLQTAARLQQPCRRVEVDVRTGDTPAADRRRQLRAPSDILVTTPESLYLMLTSRAADTLRTVHTIIVDEVHALAPTKRGAHLALSLERLCALLPEDAQRIGLSATVQPASTAARFLGGARPVTVVDRSARTFIDLHLVVPVPDMDQPPPAPAPKKSGGPLVSGGLSDGEPRQDTGMWAAIYPRIVELMQQHRSTIVFVNSRSLCERMAQRLNELADAPLVRAHHGSLAQRKRQEIEEALKAGELRGIVATSSLELGIDMGTVDLVILVESPGSVARGLQRVGRAGHGVGQLSRGIVFPKFRGDLLECTVVAERMRAGLLEPIHMPILPLDVLAQHVVSICARAPQPVDALWEMVKRAAPYASLSRDALVAVLDMVSGSYPADEFADLRPHISWDREQDILTPRRGAQLTALLNGGTIPDRGLFGVYLGEKGPRVGELDEEMVYESRKGDTFLLGASTWRVEEITRDRVIVSPAPGEPGRMPFWRGDGPGRPIELGQAVGAFVGRLGRLDDAQAQHVLRDEMHLDAYAANNLLGYIREQQQVTGTLPTDTTITVERFRDAVGDWRVCILSPFGSRVHAPWALALEAILSAKSGFQVQTLYSDDGIALRFADADEPPDLAGLLPDPTEVEDLVMQQLAHSALFASIFRENAGRALLLPRRRGRERTPLWEQRLKAKMLLAVAQRYASFPIVLETYRQCLRDIFDLPALVTLLERIQRREVVVEEAETPAPSPFARSLAFAYVAAYLYEQDAPLAERKAQALTLDRGLLQELLGQAELRDLLDPAVLEATEALLQGTAAERQARDADELHDLLRRVGDLRDDEVRLRASVDPTAWLAQLQQQRRAAPVRIAGETRWIATEDAGRMRDALGVVPPAGLPDRFLVPTPDALESLVRRYARTHGPFTGNAPAERYGLLPAQVEPVLARLESLHVLVRGELRPGGQTREWCDTEVLRRLRRGTLATLRREVAAVESQALARFLPRWHGLDAPRPGITALEAAIGQLEGLALPWSSWYQAILPARVSDFRPDMLDMLCATGAVVWVGAGPLGPRDGRVRLFRRSRAALLLDPPAAYEAPSPLHTALLAHLERRGACFTVELSQAVSGTPFNDLNAALWDLVWAGQITNDTVQPLRGLSVRTKAPRARRLGRNPQTMVGGRWSRVADLVDPQIAPTQRAHALAQTLLERHGFVSREAAAYEDIPGGFSACYGVLRAMEEAGKIRRGYFVEGLSGAQFAYAGAVERLRGQREANAENPAVDVLAAVDPANPYGALLPWPERADPESKGRPRRQSGAWVVLGNGQPLVYVEANGHGIITFAALWREADAIAQAITGLQRVAAKRRGQALYVRTIDGEPALRSPHLAALLKAGLSTSFDGLTVTGVPAASAEQYR